MLTELARKVVEIEKLVGGNWAITCNVIGATVNVSVRSSKDVAISEETISTIGDLLGAIAIVSHSPNCIIISWEVKK